MQCGNVRLPNLHLLARVALTLVLSPGQARTADHELLERLGPRGDGPVLLMDRA